MDYSYLLWLAVILLATKALGLLTEKAHLPQVVGALLAGIVLGPSCFGVLEDTDFIMKTAEIGVIMLMFIAGIDTNLEELKKTGPLALFIAAMGVFVPLLLCGGAYLLFFRGTMNFLHILKAAYVGTVFAATSVSITVETLTEMGKIKSKVGMALVSGALIDDIIGIVILSVVDGLSKGDSQVGRTLLSILLFFVFTFAVGFLIMRVFKRISLHHARSRRIAVWALAFCLVMAFCAEKLFGVADITGAFFAGVILSNVTPSRQFIAKKVVVSSYMLFSPVFFASVGLRTDLSLINGDILLLALVLLICALSAKVLGCGAACRISGMGNRDSLSVGIGMMCRGEVALMVAQKGISCGMIDSAVFPAVILVVVVSGLATPVLLKLAMSKPTPGTMIGPEALG